MSILTAAKHCLTAICVGGARHSVAGSGVEGGTRVAHEVISKLSKEVLVKDEEIKTSVFMRSRR